MTSARKGAEPRPREKALREALKLALKRWQEADWHWASEFTQVSAKMEDHVVGSPGDPGGYYEEFQRLSKLVKE